jgi:deoxyribonuclease V
MILAIDVDYRDQEAIVAGVLFRDWSDEEPLQEFLISCQIPSNYMPGEFYRRELPCIAELLTYVNTELECILIDGFVHLGRELEPGLGMHLWNMLEQKVVVIGVAKSPFKYTPKSCEVRRGKSKKPLFVTAEGIKQERAKLLIRNMHGNDRIPALLRHADRLCRGRKCS